MDFIFTNTFYFHKKTVLFSQTLFIYLNFLFVNVNVIGPFGFYFNKQLLTIYFIYVIGLYGFYFHKIFGQFIFSTWKHPLTEHCMVFTSQGRVWFLLFRVASGEQNSLGKLHFYVLAQFGVFIQHFSFGQKWFHIWYLLWAFTPVLFPSLGGVEQEILSPGARFPNPLHFNAGEATHSHSSLLCCV